MTCSDDLTLMCASAAAEGSVAQACIHCALNRTGKRDKSTLACCSGAAVPDRTAARCMQVSMSVHARWLDDARLSIV